VHRDLLCFETGVITASRYIMLILNEETRGDLCVVH
jgi:hypothetical protein